MFFLSYHIFVLKNFFFLLISRFSDYEILKDTHITDEGSFIKLFLEKSKQDQFYGGSCSYILESGGRYCPVNLFRLYFRIYGLTFEYKGPANRYLNFRLYKCKGEQKPLFGTSLAYSTAMSQSRDLFNRVGLPGRKYSETSFKSGFFY